MLRLKRLALIAALAITFVMPVAADGPSCAPGQTNTPPCAGAQQTSEDSSPASVPSNSGLEVTLVELAIDVLQSVLTLL